MEQSLQVMSKQERLENWTARIMACRSSGMTVRAWCQENGLSEKTYYYWLRRVRQEAYSQLQQELPTLTHMDSTAVTFAEIPVPGAHKSEEISFKADVVIRTGPLVIGIANSVSEGLLSKILVGISNAR